MSLLEEPAPPQRLQRLDSPVPPPAAADVTDAMTAERCAWSLVWLGVLTGGINLWGFWWSSPLTVLLAAFIALLGLGGLVACWLSRPRSSWLQRVALAAVMLSVAAPQAVIIHTRVFYSTDSAAFDDVAARALQHGHDPYTVSMSAATHLLNVPDRFWTYTVTGGHVAHASYPAGSFLVDMPALLLGIRHQVVDWIDLSAWLVTGLLLFFLLPRALRWLACLVTLTPMFVGMFSTSGTDAVFLPFLVLAVWRWDRLGQPGLGASAAPWIGPVALGAACSIKQLPWFCVPFLATGVVLEARRQGRRPGPVLIRYMTPVAAVFTAVNLPFVVWDPGAWLHGTLTPFGEPLVADGQGLVTLATHGITGGVDLTLLTAAGALAYVAILVAFVVWYPSLKRVWPLLMPVAFFFSSRSLASYLVDLFPVALVAATTVMTVPRVVADGKSRPWQPPSPRPRPSGRLLVVGGPAVAAAAVCALAFAGPPLHIAVQAVHTNHRGRAMQSIIVAVRNDTGSVLSPHFVVNTGSNPNGFWYPSSGHVPVLGPRRSATLTLYAPPQTVAPQDGAHWLVEAYTASPRSLSTSALEVWRGANG
jgi:uncharacterized membrane protein